MQSQTFHTRFLATSNDSMFVVCTGCQRKTLVIYPRRAMSELLRSSRTRNAFFSSNYGEYMQGREYRFFCVMAVCSQCSENSLLHSRLYQTPIHWDKVLETSFHDAIFNLAESYGSKMAFILSNDGGGQGWVLQIDGSIIERLFPPQSEWRRVHINLNRQIQISDPEDCPSEGD